MPCGNPAIAGAAFGGRLLAELSNAKCNLLLLRRRVAIIAPGFSSSALQRPLVPLAATPCSTSKPSVPRPSRCPTLGPFFKDVDYLDFYNLELADTNVVDHNTHK